MAQPIVPYLTVKGAAAAIAFYQDAFKASENTRMPAQDGKRLLHASLSINGGTLMLSDEFPEQGGPPAPSAERPSSAAVAMTLATPGEVDSTYQRALQRGAEKIMDPSDAFWGDRFAMLRDPFGYRWMLSAPLPK
jgi:PhnB protein